ncbi:MAG: hypothetical protein KIT84_13350 [Labilithrix sp.]|nr:hypothetical protein [Labilithrix sp.]MCW5812003.1 hypothetical protein [Labilithrix sp.]
MTQQAPAQITFREEERVLGIAYDRAVPMVPGLVKKATGAEAQELGDGYWIASVRAENGTKREVTVRLGKQGPDTRFAIRADSTGTNWKWTLFVILISILTLGFGILFFIPSMQRRLRTEQRERDLLVHKTFRAIEDAVAEQGASPGYRIAPGAGAAEPDALAEEATDESVDGRRQRTS